MSVKMKVARSVAWSYGAYAVEAIVGLALVAFVVRRIGVADYGALTLALSIASLTAVFDLGLLGLLVQACIAAREKGGVAAASRLMSAATFWLAAAGVAAFVVCGAVAALLPGPFRIDAPLVRPAALSLLFAGLAVMLSLVASGLELAHAAAGAFGRISRIQIATALFRAALTIPAVALGYGIVALAAIHAGAAAFRLLLLHAGLSRHADGVRVAIARPDFSALDGLWANRTWATADNIARQGAQAANSIVLGILASASAVAVFGIAMRIPGHLMAIANRGISVTLPYLSVQHERDELRDLRDLFASTMTVALAILVPVCALGFAFAPGIIAIIAGDSYAAAAPVLRILLVATLVQAFSIPAYQVLYARGEIAAAARIGVAESVANIVLTIILVPRFGVRGAAWATTVTHLAGTFGWYLPAAMRAANLSPRQLAESVFRRPVPARR